MSETETKKWTKPQLLAAVLDGKLTKNEAAAILEKMKKPQKPRELYCGEKGTICLRGIRKFPVLNLYPEEIAKLAEVWDAVVEFSNLVAEIEPEKRKDVDAVSVEPQTETPETETEAVAA